MSKDFRCHARIKKTLVSRLGGILGCERRELSSNMGNVEGSTFIFHFSIFISLLYDSSL